jgi:hypothetical protein
VPDRRGRFRAREVDLRHERVVLRARVVDREHDQVGGAVCDDDVEGGVGLETRRRGTGRALSYAAETIMVSPSGRHGTLSRATTRDLLLSLLMDQHSVAVRSRVRRRSPVAVMRARKRIFPCGRFFRGTTRRNGARPSVPAKRPPIVNATRLTERVRRTRSESGHPQTASASNGRADDEDARGADVAAFALAGAQHVQPPSQLGLESRVGGICVQALELVGIVLEVVQLTRAVVVFDVQEVGCSEPREVVRARAVLDQDVSMGTAGAKGLGRPRNGSWRAGWRLPAL